MNEMPKVLVAASSRILILSILRAGSSYGYKILQTVKLLADGEWSCSDGLIYPVLHKMENEKLIISSWEKIGPSRKRKYYTITEKGIKALEKSVSEWKFVDFTLKKSMGGKVCQKNII